VYDEYSFLSFYFLYFILVHPLTLISEVSWQMLGKDVQNQIGIGRKGGRKFENLL
jgi:hypothetical protein